MTRHNGETELPLRMWKLTDCCQSFPQNSRGTPLWLVWLWRIDPLTVPPKTPHRSRSSRPGQRPQPEQSRACFPVAHIIRVSSPWWMNSPDRSLILPLSEPVLLKGGLSVQKRHFKLINLSHFPLFSPAERPQLKKDLQQRAGGGRKKNHCHPFSQRWQTPSLVRFG